MWAALGAILLAHALALPQVFLELPLRADSDTAVMLDAVQRTGGLAGAWRWFVGDWLLENGFYRPISSLSIVLDHALYGETAWGFRLTNWLLMVLTAIGAFFLTRAYALLVDNPRADWLAMGVAAASSLQQTGLTYALGNWSAWWFVGLAVVGIGVVRHSSKFSNLTPRFPLSVNGEGGETDAHTPDSPSPFTERGLGGEVQHRAKRGLGGEVQQAGENETVASAVEVEPCTLIRRGPGGEGEKIGKGEVLRGSWLPLFLAVGALFWGFDRLLETHYTRLITWVPSRTALLGTMFSVWTMYCLLRGASARRRGWLGLGGAFYLLALGSYEQPIMLIPLIGALAFWRRRQWSAWGWKAFGAVALAGALIIALRISLLPTEPTRYQQQQLRSSLTGPIMSYLTELIPPTAQWQYWQSVGTNFEILLLDKQGWDNLVGTLLYLGVLTAFWRGRALLGGALLWHALAFLPMAFLHYFEHYMYLPQLGKTLFDVGLITWGAQLLTRFSVKACSE